MASRRRVDDSDEAEEATALDLRPSSRSARPADPLPLPARKPVIPARRVVDDDSSEDDGEATEFLSVRPASRVSSPPSPSGPLPRALPSSIPTPQQAAEPRGNRRAVPIAGAASSTESPAAPAPAPPPGPRPLPARAVEPPGGNTSTGSIPRVTRIQVVNRSMSSTGDHDVHGLIRADDDDVERTLPPDRDLPLPRPAMAPAAPAARPKRPSTVVDLVDDETQAPEDLDPEETQAPQLISDLPLPPQRPASPAPPPARRVPLTAEGDTQPLPTVQPKPAPRAPQPPPTPELHDGVLVVEAPVDATITVNGVDRGRGVVRVSDLDRDARHAVRIHAPGFQPWSGSVSLQGKPAAKIRPTLKPRAR